jgi:hypothetical protein
VNNENLKPFLPGQSGNPKGRPKSRPITAALKELLYKDDSKALRAIAAVAVREALGGDFRYTKEIIDRVEGKALETLEVSGGMDVMNLPGLTASQLAKIAEDEECPD